MLFKQHIRHKHEEKTWDGTGLYKSSNGYNYAIQKNNKEKENNKYNFFQKSGLVTEEQEQNEENLQQKELMEAINNEIIERSFEEKNIIKPFLLTVYPLLGVLPFLTFLMFNLKDKINPVILSFLVFLSFFVIFSFGIFIFVSRCVKFYSHATNMEVNLFKKLNIKHIFTSQIEQRKGLLSLAYILENSKYHTLCELGRVNIQLNNREIMSKCNKNIFKISQYLKKEIKIKTLQKINAEIANSEIQKQIINAYFSSQYNKDNNEN